MRLFSLYSRIGIAMSIFIFCSLASIVCYAQNETEEEATIFLQAKGIVSTTATVVIKDQSVYLPLSSLFEFLGINNKASIKQDSISGFFCTEPNYKYLVDGTNNKLKFGDQTFEFSKNSIILKEEIFIRIDVYQQVFGITCSFNHRNLTVDITAPFEFPSQKNKRLEEMRKNLQKLRGTVKADTIISNKFRLISIGAADWLFTSTRVNDQHFNAANLLIGGTLAGGEMNVSLNYSNGYGVKFQQQLFWWRYVNNDNKLLRQVLVGKIFPQSTSRILTPVIGVQLSNISTRRRNSFGAYQINNITEPNTVVELYINNVLIDYTQADETGNYKLNVPLLYGTTTAKLKYYSNEGKEREKEQIIDIPFNLLPARQFEYQSSTGFFEGTRDIFSMTNFTYGVKQWLTIGAGLEFLSKLKEQPLMPVTNATIKLNRNFLLTAQYIYGVKAHGTINYKLKKGVQLNIALIRYNKTQTAIRHNYLSENKASVFFPLKLRKISSYSSLTLNEFTTVRDKLVNAEWTLNASTPGINLNITTSAFLTKNHKQVISTARVSTRLLKTWYVRPQIGYDYHRQKLSEISWEVEKQVNKRGIVNFSYGSNSFTSSPSYNVLLRYDLSFMQVLFSAGKTPNAIRTVQSFRGSLRQTNNRITAANRSSIGRASIIIVPFLDLNNNGKQDMNEHRVSGLQVQINNNVIKQTSDTAFYSHLLEPNAYHLVQLKSRFRNLAWQTSVNTLNVKTEANHAKIIEVPVHILGEVSGKLSDISARKNRGIKVVIYNENKSFIKYISIDENGFFSYMGLAPGAYTVSISTNALEDMQLKCKPIEFVIKEDVNGDIVEDLQLVVLEQKTISSATANKAATR